MEQSLRGGLSLTSSGFGFWSHDIGGFENTSTPDVYKRWAAFGLLSTHSRLHGSTSYRVPWNYDEEAVDVVRFFTGLKKSLLPYLYSQAVYTSKTGIPMMRSMALEFPEEENCRYLDKQYMLGEHLLVSPVFYEEGTAHFYLPEGRWTDYLTGTVMEEGRWISRSESYLSIPLMARENSVIPVCPLQMDQKSDAGSVVEWKIFELTGQAEGVICDGRSVIARCVVEQREGRIRCTMEGRGGCIRFVNRKLKAVQGARLQRSGADTLVYVSDHQAFEAELG